MCNGVWAAAIMEDARARSLGIMLTGQCGNMSISFDGMTVLPQMLQQGRLTALGRTVFALLRNGTRPTTVGAQLFGPFVPRSLWRIIQRARGKKRRLQDYSAISPALEGQVAAMAADRGLDFSYRPRRDPSETRRWVLERTDPGNYNKGSLGVWGVELRDPTGDRRLIELCMRIPAEQFLAGGVPRSLARHAFADRLPAELLSERRKGYQAADWHETLKAERDEVANEINRCSTATGVAEVISIERIRGLIEDWPVDGWDGQAPVEKYRLALLRGISAAHFLRRASGSNA